MKKQILSSKLETTSEIKQAIKYIKQGENVFIHGRPGTGKSTFLNTLRESLKKKNFIYVAPTGIAALNIHGQTIHSFFNINPQDIYAPIGNSKISSLRSAWQEMDILVIDEISMVRADIFDRIDDRLRTVFKTNRTFANKQVVVVGDLHQLPPVLNPKSDLEQDRICRENYPSAYAFDAKCWKSLNFKDVFFTKVFRQKDKKFNNNLLALESHHNKNFLKALQFFNERVLNERPKGAVCLCARKIDAEKINEAELDKLPMPIYTIRASESSYFPFDWSGNNCPAPKILKLKIGAKVMFLRNDDEKRFVNGTVGYIKSINADSSQEDAVESITVRIPSGGEITLRRYTWYKTILNKETGRQEADLFNYYCQFPLQLAWATTIHKAQGMTFDSTYVDMGEEGAFSTGQAYVALSRVRSIEGLSLKHPIKERDILDNPAVEQFYKTIQR